jgi:prolyl oligopeptidase
MLIPIFGSASAANLRYCAFFEGYVRTFTLYLAALGEVMAGDPVWRRIFTPESGVQSVAISDGTLYALAVQEKPLPKLMAMPAKDGARSEASAVPTSTGGFLSEIFAARHGVIAISNDAGYQSLHAIDAAGRSTRIGLPFEGWIQGVDVSHEGDSILAWITSWFEPGQIFSARIEGSNVRRPPYQPDIPFDLSAYELRREFATSADGKKIPVSILSRRDLRGSGPALVHAYGAYQWPSQPSFNPSDIAFLDAGGVVATAHVRGGGEYGAAWHEGGRKETNPTHGSTSSPLASASSNSG